MKLGAVIVSAFLLLAPQLSRADFKYTESTKITGGALGGLMKFASRVGGTRGLPDSSTYYIRGNRMRVEEGDAKIEIVDLDARHIVRMDAKKHTYVVLTFEEMRAQLDKARQGQTNGSSVELETPAKINMKATQNVRTILGQRAHEVQATMEMQSGEELQATSGGALTITSDMWIASDVRGYGEVRNFFQRMMREMNWAPGRMGADPRMAKAREELEKSSSAVNGFPLLATVEMAAKSSDGQATPRKQRGDDDAVDPATPTNVPTAKGDSANTALGGLLGLRKHKHDANQRAAANSDDELDADSGALMKATTEVISFSTSQLDPALFDIPAEYRQAQNKKGSQ
jgi:hypothetical protein